MRGGVVLAGFSPIVVILGIAAFATGEAENPQSSCDGEGQCVTSDSHLGDGKKVLGGGIIAVGVAMLGSGIAIIAANLSTGIKVDGGATSTSAVKSTAGDAWLRLPTWHDATMGASPSVTPVFTRRF